MTEAKQPLKVFLCHASADKPAVRDLYKRLAADGVDVWLDAESLIAGQNWQVEIPKAIKDADVVIVCLSEKSINKEGYVQKEIKFALDIADEKPEGTIFIVPARLEECAVPDRLSTYHWVDLFADEGYERLMRALRLRADKIDATLQVKKRWLSPITTPIKPPKKKTRSNPLFRFLRERKETVFSAFGIMIALLALLFGDNIYEQFTGHSIFAAKPVSTLTSTATFTVTFQPITPSRTIVPSRMPTQSSVSKATVTSIRTSTPAITPTATFTPTRTPTAPLSISCTWRATYYYGGDSFGNVVSYECLCNNVICSCNVVDYSGKYYTVLRRFQESRSWVNGRVNNSENGQCETK